MASLEIRGKVLVWECLHENGHCGFYRNTWKLHEKQKSLIPHAMEVGTLTCQSRETKYRDRKREKEVPEVTEGIEEDRELL